ncbi:hypothetical protein [Flavobacterium chungangense]|uniref:Uncharacterized protein n=1 Tax=Flavobacterium chungangense TaxID=554283 RepID=A0A6V6Z2S0_9FLAO|nr:hypothetical protein [Flavobacterium chungangense]CAD0005896.1 hypothetical protein FLACHUCJ7_02562 [Flavobacterium chungangense]
MSQECKEKFKIGNCYLISDYPKNEEVRVKVIENIKDKFIVFSNLEDDSEFIFIKCDLNLSENDDIKYVCSKLSWTFNSRRFNSRRKESWNNRFEEEEFKKLDKIIGCLNASKEIRELPIDISNHNFSYKFLYSN